MNFFLLEHKTNGFLNNFDNHEITKGLSAAKKEKFNAFKNKEVISSDLCKINGNFTD